MALTEISNSELASLCDRKVDYPVVSHRLLWQGRVMGLAEDIVHIDAERAPIQREYTTHPGAVAIVALRGEAGSEEILLERQYRHPVRAQLWEIPAGLLDIEGEDPLVAAQRELAEEADLKAERWDVLTDYFTSPGGCQESIRIFLARDLSPTDEVFERIDEEADMVAAWIPLEQAVTYVLEGRIHNPNAVHGILAADAARNRQWEGLRGVDAPWMR